MMRRGWTKFVLTAAPVVLVTAGIVLYSRRDCDRPPTVPVPPQAIPVIATTVQQHDVPIVLTEFRAVTALNTARVQSPSPES